MSMSVLSPVVVSLENISALLVLLLITSLDPRYPKTESRRIVRKGKGWVLRGGSGRWDRWE